VIAWPAGHDVGSGVVRPHAAATSAMTGVVTCCVMRHAAASWPPFACTSSHTEAGWSSTNGAAMTELAASSRFVAVIEMLAPTSPDETSSPRARMLWFANSTNEPVADWASAVLATVVARRTKNAQRSIRRVMSSLLQCPGPRPLRWRLLPWVTWGRVPREGSLFEKNRGPNVYSQKRRTGVGCPTPVRVTSE
jgi:hypothetical protein